MANSSKLEAELRFEQATPEELAQALAYSPRLRSMGTLRGIVFALEPVVGNRKAEGATVTAQGTTTVTHHGPGHWGPQDYILRRGVKGWWLLVLAGAETALPDGKVVKCIEYLLKNPPSEPIHGSELAGRARGELVTEGQRNLALDDRETMAAKKKARRECLAVLDNPGANETEKQEAQTQLDGIDAWAQKHLRGTEGGEQRQVRAIRQTMRRFLKGLETATDLFGRPDMVQRAFGEHLDRCMMKPSARGCRGRNARVRAGLAGRFTYEPPAGVKWKG